jgi:hypothetical protein
LCSGVADSPHHHSECDAGAGGEVERNTHRNGSQCAAEFSWIAAVREHLMCELVDSREERIVSCESGFLGHAKTFATAVPQPSRVRLGGREGVVNLWKYERKFISAR